MLICEDQCRGSPSLPPASAPGISTIERRKRRYDDTPASTADVYEFQSVAWISSPKSDIIGSEKRQRRAQCEKKARDDSVRTLRWRNSTGDVREPAVTLVGEPRRNVLESTMVHGSKVSSDSSTEEVAQRDLGGEMGEQQLTTETSAAPQNRFPLMSKAQEITDSTARLGGGNLLPMWEMEANLKPCKDGLVKTTAGATRVWNYLKKRAVQVSPGLHPRFQGHQSTAPRKTGEFVVPVLGGVKIEVTLTNEAAVVDKWIRERVVMSEKNTAIILGMDVEWRPNRWRGSNNRVALLQLATGSHCLLVQMLYLDNTPKLLGECFSNPQVQLGGVGVVEDARKLARDHGINCERQAIDLNLLAAKKMKQERVRTLGLKKLAEVVLGQPVAKNKRITMSDWSRHCLGLDQVQYAAQDAWLGHAILQKFHMPCPNIGYI